MDTFVRLSVQLRFQNDQNINEVGKNEIKAASVLT